MPTIAGRCPRSPLSSKRCASADRWRRRRGVWGWGGNRPTAYARGWPRRDMPRPSRMRGARGCAPGRQRCARATVRAGTARRWPHSCRARRWNAGNAPIEAPLGPMRKATPQRRKETSPRPKATRIATRRQDLTQSDICPLDSVTGVTCHRAALRPSHAIRTRSARGAARRAVPIRWRNPPRPRHPNRRRGWHGRGSSPRLRSRPRL